MERGTITSGPDPMIDTPLADNDLAAVQEWPVDPANPGLDRRGNWNVFSEMIGQAPATTTQTRVPNGVNEYETIDPDGSGPLAPASLQHDPAGNLTLDPLARNHDDPPGLGNETGQAYEYDEENRLTAVRRASDGGPGHPADELLLEIRYDALGRRIESIDYTGVSDPNAACPGGTGGGGSPHPVLTRHIYAGIETLEEYVCCDVTAPGGPCADPSGFTLAREFVWGDRFPEPIAMIDHTNAGDVPADGQPGGGPETLHYVHDILGGVVALTDSTGSVVERYTYDPYGETVIEQTDPATGLPVGRLPASRYGNPFAWTAQRYDAGVELYHFLFRSYSPRLGRWLQRDPNGYIETVSLYEYVGSRPLEFSDPAGLQSRPLRQPPTPPEGTQPATQPAPGKPTTQPGTKPSRKGKNPRYRQKPKTATRIKRVIRVIRRGGYVVIIAETADGRRCYNCAAHALGHKNLWVQPEDKDGDRRVSEKELDEFIRAMGCKKKGNKPCPSGTNPTRFYRRPNGDFHVIRGEKDGWSEKCGPGPEGGPIDDPDDHERNDPEGGRGRPHNGTYCCPQGKVKA